MITIKMNELLNATEALQNLSKKELKARLALSISRILKNAEGEIQNFNENRMNLIKKYGEKDDKGELITTEDGNCKIPDESIKEFSTELNDILDATIDINANKMTMEQLEDLDFTPKDMAMLEPFIENEEKE